MTRQQTDRRRVFCIGWHKTGTSTLGLALLRLGYSVVGCRLDMVHPLTRGNVDAVLAVAQRYDAVQDVPWAVLYRELDARFPSSKFVLTERDEEDWFESARRHFGSVNIPLHEWIYGHGVLEGNEELYRERFRSHYTAVREYFDDRPNDLLRLNLAAGDGWEKLCTFLERGIPIAAFPHENKAPKNRTPKDRMINSLRDATPEPIRNGFFEMKLKIRKLLGLRDPRDRFNNFRQNRKERRSWQLPGENSR